MPVSFIEVITVDAENFLIKCVDIEVCAQLIDIDIIQPHHTLFIHTYIPFYPNTYILTTYIPIYLYTYIPIYLYTYIPLYLYTYIYTFTSTPSPTRLPSSAFLPRPR